jgi:hypothetical protein
MTKSDQITTEQLRKLALEKLASSGKGAARRIDLRSQQYRLDDPEIAFRLRTNRKQVLILETDAPDAGAKLRIEDVEYLLFACPNGSGIDVYWIPTATVAADARREHAEWLKTCKTGGDNRTWQMIFDRVDGVLCHGYAKRYAGYLL